jgi:hypothetical protein
VGRDFRFGALRTGDYAALEAAGARHGFEVESIPDVLHEGVRVSSSAVREALKAGDLFGAERLLGHAYTISGRVAHGPKLGRKLGFPTANLQLRWPPPLSGIFVVKANVREVEQQLDRMEVRAAGIPEGTTAPLGVPESFDDHMTVTYDLMRLAFQGDISRVFTFMVGHEGSSRSYAHIGIPEPHHPVSHHADKPEGIEKYAKLTTYQVVKLAEFIEKLKTTAEGDGTLLDSSLIYFGSGMGNGNAHDRNNPPVAILGGANGKLKGNRHIAVENKEPTANLLLSFADMANAEVEKIGHSTGRLIL